MSLHAVNIQGINITSSSKKEILEEIQRYLFQNPKPKTQTPKSESKSFTIVTPNPEQIVYAKQDLHFASLLNQADVALPDGIGVVWASRMASKFTISNFQHPITEAIPGVDFMEDLVAIPAKQHVPIALIGGKSKVAVSTFECLRQIHPDLRGVAMDAPEFTIGSSGLAMNGSIEEYFKNLVATLKNQGIGMCFVALGAPKQEYFIERLRLSFRPSSRNLNDKKQIPGQAWDDNERIILMSVGGSFDEISGRVLRAPGWVSGLALKWLWRLILEPWRIKRQLSLVKFVWLIVSERLLGRFR